MKKGEWILKKDGAEWKPIGALLRNVLETNQEGVRPVRLEANHFCPPGHVAQPQPISFLMDSTPQGTRQSPQVIFCVPPAKQLIARSLKLRPPETTVTAFPMIGLSERSTKMPFGLATFGNDIYHCSYHSVIVFLHLFLSASFHDNWAWGQVE